MAKKIMKRPLKLLLLVVVLILIAYMTPHIMKDINGYGSGQNIISDKQAQELSYYLNINDKSAVHSYLLGSNGEYLALMQNTSGSLSEIYFRSKIGGKGKVTLTDSLLPKVVNYEGSTAYFSSYTDNSVDIKVVHIDGSNEEFPEVPLIVKEKQTTIRNQVQEQGNIAWNVLSCGLPLGTLLFTSGVESPMVYAGCGALEKHSRTLNTHIGDCDKSAFLCVGEEVLKTVNLPRSEEKTGIIVRGEIKNALTKSVITNGIISYKEQTKRQRPRRGEWHEDGEYNVHIINEGSYFIDLDANGFEDTYYSVSITDKLFDIYDSARVQLYNQERNTDELIELVMILEMEPSGYIKGIIEDEITGEPIANAKVSLLFDSKEQIYTVSDKEGLFAIKPPVVKDGNSKQAFELYIKAKNYTAKNITGELTYEVIPNSDEYRIADFESTMMLRKIDDSGLFLGEYSASFEDSSSMVNDLQAVSLETQREIVGNITIEVDKKNNISCMVSFEQRKLVVSEEGETIEEMRKGDSTECKGIVDEKGYFSAEGVTNVIVDSLGQQIKTSTIIAINGQIIDDEIVGSLIIDGNEKISFD